VEHKRHFEECWQPNHFSDHRLQLFRQKTLKHLSQYTLCSTKERKSFRFRTTNYVAYVM